MFPHLHQQPLVKGCPQGLSPGIAGLGEARWGEAGTSQGWVWPSAQLWQGLGREGASGVAAPAQEIQEGFLEEATVLLPQTGFSPLALCPLNEPPAISGKGTAIPGGQAWEAKAVLSQCPLHRGGSQPRRPGGPFAPEGAEPRSHSASSLPPASSAASRFRAPPRPHAQVLPASGPWLPGPPALHSQPAASPSSPFPPGRKQPPGASSPEPSPPTGLLPTWGKVRPEPWSCPPSPPSIPKTVSRIRKWRCPALV